MADTTMKCPHCVKILRSATPLAAGTLVQCPGCKNSFPFEGDVPIGSGIQPATSIPNWQVPSPNAPYVPVAMPVDDDDSRRDRRPDRDDDRPRRRRRDRDDYDDGREDRPWLDDQDDYRKRRPTSRRQGRDDDDYARPSPGWKKTTSGSILGGIAMMVIAAVWFFVALQFAGYIFFYPPILFVAGLITFIRGLASSD